jgi:hypothetical protein
MKKSNRSTAPSKLVLRREALVVLGVTELGRVAGGSQLDHCTTTHQTTRTPDTN